MSNAFQQRLGAFRSKFQQVLGGRSSQYEELSTLEAPLVGNENSHVPGDSDQVDSYGAPRPEGYHSGRPVEQTDYSVRSGATSQHAVPSQVCNGREAHTLGHHMHAASSYVMAGILSVQQMSLCTLSATPAEVSELHIHRSQAVSVFLNCTAGR